MGRADQELTVSLPYPPMLRTGRFLDLWHLIWGCLLGPVWVFLLHPLWRQQAARQQKRPWVIGGHRGRVYADNSAAVEQVARSQGQHVLWIANRCSAPIIGATGVHVLVRHSWAARRAISSAEVLVYSHGEDDLDAMMAWLRGRSALRCYLNHCLNLMKAGGVYEPGWGQQNCLVRGLRRWLITDCDRFYCASEVEMRNFERSYPMHQGKFRYGGGAHLDDIMAQRAPAGRRIYWFPTFRESPSARKRLLSVIREVVSSPRLQAWLLENDYEFFIGAHVNTTEAPLTLEAPFVRADPARLIRDLGSTEILISDYSSIVFDFMMYDRVPILFAFDLLDYQKSRYFYQDYETIDYALHARTVPELVEAIIAHTTQSSHLVTRLAHAKAQLLPPGTHFALRTYQAILADLSETSGAMGRPLK